MDFVGAMKAINEGKQVFRLSNTGTIYYADGGDVISEVVAEGDVDDAQFSQEDYLATDWALVAVGLKENEAYMVFSPEKDRWVSTTSPEKQKAAGLKVAVFTFARRV